MRLHLFALPHTQLTEDYLTCAYTQKVVKFLRMMAGRHEVYLYAGEDVSGVRGTFTEHVVCITEEERRGWFGDGFDTVKSPFKWDVSEPYWRRFAERATPALAARCEKGDLVLVTSGGNTQLPIAQALVDQDKAIACEWAVGYEGVVSQFAAFESYAWMHHVYGIRGWRNGRAFDQVIPNYFDEADFLSPRPPRADRYLLYLARVTGRKGPHIAGQIAERLGMKLVIAGPGGKQIDASHVFGDGVEIEGNVEYVGAVDKRRRAELMANAACFLAPTVYVEPFGGAAIEAMMSGCPVVASDWGAFTETVTPTTGRLFRTLGQGCAAVEEAMTLDREAVAREARSRYSLDAVRPRFERWFEQLQTLRGKGYYA